VLVQGIFVAFSHWFAIETLETMYDFASLLECVIASLGHHYSLAREMGWDVP
jgi:hypothetical protein